MRAADIILKKNRAVPAPRRDAPSVVETTAAQPSGNKHVAIMGVCAAAQAHADALQTLAGVQLEGVVDKDLERARSFAWRNGGVPAAASLGDLLAAQQVDAVHILAPAETRADFAREALSLGLAVLTESPVAPDLRGAQAWARAAEGGCAKQLAVNHHALFHPAFVQLAETLKSRRCGPVTGLSAAIVLPLPQDNRDTPPHEVDWDPAGLLRREAGQPLAQILSLTGPIARWNIMAGAPDDARAVSLTLTGAFCEAQLYLQFGATYPVWQLTAFCADGIVKADMLRNRFNWEERSKNPDALDKFLEAGRLGREFSREARQSLLAHGRALLGLGRRADVAHQSLGASIAAFHRGDIAWVSTPEGAEAIARLCEKLAAEISPPPRIRSHASKAGFKAEAVVLGGDGFIGRHIVKAFADSGLKVAAVSPAPAMFPENGDVRFFQADLHDGEELARLADGAAVLINASDPPAIPEKAGCERRSQALVAALGDTCRRAGIRRLVHLSSLEALYLGDKDDVITGRAPVDPYDWQRDARARARGVEEVALLTAYEEGLLPVTILRPGIVLGEGGTPYPQSVGQFVQGRHCLGWNKGLNPLPFVLAEDVAAAVVAAAQKDGALGHCFNLVGDVRLSASTYVAALGKMLGRPFVFHPRSPDGIYLSGLAKAGFKRAGRGSKALSRRELMSRTMAATFDCSDIKAALAWRPVADRETFLARGLGVHAASPKAEPI